MLAITLTYAKITKINVAAWGIPKKYNKKTDYSNQITKVSILPFP
jgi:hypothetical protein